RRGAPARGSAAGEGTAGAHSPAPGTPACTSASACRTSEWSAPPRARIARSSSARGTHPLASAHASPSRIAQRSRRTGVCPAVSSTVVDSMSALRSACWGALLLVGCAPRVPAPQPAPPPAQPPAGRRSSVSEAMLDNGATVARVEIPPSPSGRKPAVLVNLNESNALLDEGVIAVTYKIDWTRLPGAPPPPTPADKAGG